MMRFVVALLASLLVGGAQAQIGVAFPGPGTVHSVSGALSCSYAPVTSGTQGTLYTGATPSPSGGAGGNTFSETGSLPTGITINSSTGVLSGTPSVNGSFPTIQVKVTDSASTVANCGSAFTLTIAASGGTLTQDTNTTAVQASGASSAVITYSTTHANDIIVCSLHSLDTAVPVISGFAGASLTWTRVGSALTSPSLTIGNGVARQSIDIFWALATTAITSQVLTATFSAPYNAATINCQSWENANTSSPLDPNASLPKTAANGTTTPTVSQATAVSTTNAATVFIAIMGSQDANTPVAGTGYTLDIGNVNGNSFTNEAFGVEHKVNSSAQSSVTVPFSSGVTNADWLMEVIAITQ